MALRDYEKLRELLLKNEQWPLVYMFKFIVPNSGGKVNEVVALLPSDGELSFKHTQNLKYVSVTCKATMHSVDAIISITDKAVSIPGVIAL
ncbi:MAG: hypothetical protein WCX31_02205 [Salinivirgaceae bacterium]|jgi:hypothetical protein